MEGFFDNKKLESYLTLKTRAPPVDLLEEMDSCKDCLTPGVGFRAAFPRWKAVIVTDVVGGTGRAAGRVPSS